MITKVENKFKFILEFESLDELERFDLALCVARVCIQDKKAFLCSEECRSERSYLDNNWRILLEFSEIFNKSLFE